MSADIVKIKSDLAALKLAVLAAFKRYADDVSKLQAQLAAGSTVTQADLDDLTTSIEAETASVNTVDVPASPGPVPPVPTA